MKWDGEDDCPTAQGHVYEWANQDTGKQNFTLSAWILLVKFIHLVKVWEMGRPHALHYTYGQHMNSLWQSLRCTPQLIQSPCLSEVKKGEQSSSHMSNGFIIYINID